jgi:cytochrome c oxidase subunit III
MANAHAKNHDYHIVDPSPWPFVGSLSAFIMAVGAIMSMKGLAIGGLKAGPVLLTLGLLGVLYTMASWWSDVINEAQNRGNHTRVVQMHHRYGMIMFIASEVMFFVAWFWAFFDSSIYAGEEKNFLRMTFTGGHWPPQGVEVLDPWHFPLINTLLLLTSSTTVTWAHHALLHNDRDGVKQALWLTIGLALCFTGVQAYEYTHAAFGFSGNIYGATFFMATGFHGFHVIVGTIFLAVCLLRMYRGDFTPQQHLGFEFAAWYWHFVDVVWMFLFVSIYLWGSHWGAAAIAH